MASVSFGCYQGSHQMEELVRLIESDLSEPYTNFTYHYFLHNWPHLCHTAIDEGTGRVVGVALGKIELRDNGSRRGYIAMVVVHPEFRGRSIGSQLIRRVLSIMLREGVAEVYLETEVSNHKALSLYSKLGFVRTKRMSSYYLNGSDAFRMMLWFQ